MRSPLILIAFLCICLFGSFSVGAPGYALERRDDPPPSSSSGGDGDGATSSKNNFPSISSTTSAEPSGTDAPASSGKSSPTVSVASSAASGAATAAANSTSNATSAASSTPSADDGGDDEPALPIPPTLNAVWVVGGILLLLSGTIYTFVGIKHKQIQVFLSAAFFAAIGITVLIIYVLVPPVSVGGEGAYLVAIVLPGILLGGLSIVFKDVTEGLGCGVGGFALSMWLLCLRQGGLITQEAGKVIFICVFTGVIFSLSFSHHTRSYGLIGATAFGGATALILGVDCLAGVGLKEFWVYIWNVNTKIFPLNTHTYPMTKGMIAEISAIPIAAFFGVLSQIKIWKILERKREKRAAEQAEKERQKEIEEEKRGKDLLVQTEAEKMLWEQAYGDGPRDNPGGVHSDSGIGSEASASEKGSVKRWSGSTKGKAAETNVEVYEMSNLAGSSTDKLARRSTPHIVVSVAEEPGLEAEEEAKDENPTSRKDEPAQSTREPTGDDDFDEEAQIQRPATKQEASWISSLKGMSLKPKSTTPAVIPLPFSVPNSEGKEKEDDASSVATAASSLKRMSKRMSSSSLMETLTKNRLSFHKKKESDGSSVQAIADSPSREHFETGSTHLSRTNSNTDMSHDGNPVSVSGSADRANVRPLSVGASSNVGVAAEATYFDFNFKNDSELLSPTAPAQTPPLESVASSVGHGAKESATLEQSGPSLDPVSRSPSEVPVQDGPGRLSLAALQDDTVTKVFHTYRTNEWAKHISHAGIPEEDSIPKSGPPSPSMTLDPESLAPGANNDIPPAPLNPKSNSNRSSLVSAPTSEETPAESATSEAAATAENMAPEATPAEPAAPKAAWPKRTSRRVSVAAGAEPQPSSRPQIARGNSQEGRSSSRMSAMRSSSNSRSRGAKSRQATQPIVSSPIQEDVEANFVSPPGRSSTLPSKRTTLLEHRESMMSQTSLVRSGSQASIHKAPITNATYHASRTSLAQTQSRPVSSMSRRSSNPEPLNLNRQVSSGSMRSNSQTYSPPVPVRTYSPMPNLDTQVVMPAPVMQPITHTSPVAPADKPLHYRNYAPTSDLQTQRMAAWRSGLHNDNQMKRASSMVDIDQYTSAAGQQYLANQRASKQIEHASKQSVGWSGGINVQPAVNQTGYADPNANAAMQAQAHQDILRRMQSKAKAK